MGAVPPDGAGDEPGKHRRKPRIEPAGVNPRGNLDQDVGAPPWPVAGWAIRMGGRDPIQDSGSDQEIVDQGIDDNETRPDGEPPGAGCASPHQQTRQRHGDDFVGNPINMPERVDQGGPGRREVARI